MPADGQIAIVLQPSMHRRTEPAAWSWVNRPSLWSRVCRCTRRNCRCTRRNCRYARSSRGWAEPAKVGEKKKGWLKGLEPSTLGITIRCSNQLSYSHRVWEPITWVFDNIPVPVRIQATLSIDDHKTAGRNDQFCSRARNQPKPPATPREAAHRMDNLKENGFVWEAYNTQKTIADAHLKPDLLRILSVV